MELNMKKVHAGTDRAISGITILAGVGLYFVNPVLGIVIGIIGLVLFIFYKAGYRANGTGPLLSKKSVNMDQSYAQPLKDFLNGKEIKLNIKDADSNGSLRLETYSNKEAKIVYAQLFQFSNYDYEKSTELVELHSPKAEQLLTVL